MKCRYKPTHHAFDPIPATSSTYASLIRAACFCGWVDDNPTNTWEYKINAACVYLIKHRGNGFYAGRALASALYPHQKPNLVPADLMKVYVKDYI